MNFFCSNLIPFVIYNSCKMEFEDFSDELIQMILFYVLDYTSYRALLLSIHRLKCVNWRWYSIMIHPHTKTLIGKEMGWKGEIKIIYLHSHIHTIIPNSMCSTMNYQCTVANGGVLLLDELQILKGEMKIRELYQVVESEMGLLFYAACEDGMTYVFKKHDHESLEQLISISSSLKNVVLSYSGIIYQWGSKIAFNHFITNNSYYLNCLDTSTVSLINCIYPTYCDNVIVSLLDKTLLLLDPMSDRIVSFIKGNLATGRGQETFFITIDSNESIKVYDTMSGGLISTLNGDYTFNGSYRNEKGHFCISYGGNAIDE